MLNVKETLSHNRKQSKIFPIKFIFLRLLTLMAEYVLSFEYNIKDTTKANPIINII